MKKYRVIRNYVSEHYTIIEAENEDIAIEKAQNLTDGSWSPTINDGRRLSMTGTAINSRQK